MRCEFPTAGASPRPTDRLRRLCDASGASGDEGAVRCVIEGMISGHADHIETDRSGNLLVFKRGAERGRSTLMFSAHMDEAALMLTHICEDGTMRFACTGAIDVKTLQAKRVDVHGTADTATYPGVICAKAVHLQSKEEKGRPPKEEDLSIDCGFSGRGQALKCVSVGDPVTFAPDFALMGADNGYIRSKALDDRVGCLTMIRMLESDLPRDCRFAFTVCEEIGCRGAMTAANIIKPDIAVSFEATTAADIADMPEHKRVCRLGGGAVLSFMDKGWRYDAELNRQLYEEADRRGIPWQYKEYVAGGNESAAVGRSGEGVRCVTVAVPCRYIHTSASVCCAADIEAQWFMGMLAAERLSNNR